MTAIRAFFYVQHLLGIGHLARASRIAQAMVEAGMEVTMVTGGMPVPGFPDAGVHHVALPALAIGEGGFSGLVNATGQPADKDELAHRRDLLLEAFASARPDVVITEAFPFGRRQMRFELLPLLDAISAARPRPLLMASVRDILQVRAKPQRDQETVDLIRNHYDRVLVHGDPAFAALSDSFPLTSQIADRVMHTGLVCQPAPRPSAEKFDVVVSAGGGAVGATLVQAAVAAIRLRPALGACLVITGPNLPQADYDALMQSAPDNVTVARFRTDFAAVLASARLSISQAGYNTVADILQAGCRALLVPFASGGETEQTQRATLLSRAGRAVMLSEAETDGHSVAIAMDRALTQDPSAATTFAKTDGAARTATILQDLVASH